jgi:glucuronokinase
MEFYGVSIPKQILPGVILEVETKELGIPAGYQDRVIQVYEGVVYMDFNQDHLREHGYGLYEELEPHLLPPLYVAYLDDLSEGTEVFHNDIRSRWERGEPQIVGAMKKFAQFAADARDALLTKEYHWLSHLMNENFNLRASLYQLSRKNIELVQTARDLGCSSKFAGSGGAVVGIMPDDSVFPRLVEAYARMGAKVIRPIIL